MIQRILNYFMGRNTTFYQASFKPKNPSKCINIKNGKLPYARSSWETRMFNWCDTNDNVIHWGSEIVEIPYIFEVDQKIHKYYPDIWCKLKDVNGKEQIYLIEIKPQKQTTPPKVPKNKTKKSIKNYNYARYHYIKNKNKWKFAQQYCETRMWKFRVMSEGTLF